MKKRSANVDCAKFLAALLIMAHHMPLFIFHWYVGTLVDLFGSKYGWDGNLRISIYFFATLCVSIVLMPIMEHLRKWNAFLKRDFALID